MLEIWPFRRGCDFHSIDINMYIFIVINFFLLIWNIWTYWFSTVLQFQINIHKAIMWPFILLCHFQIMCWSSSFYLKPSHTPACLLIVAVYTNLLSYKYVYMFFTFLLLSFCFLSIFSTFLSLMMSPLYVSFFFFMGSLCLNCTTIRYWVADRWSAALKLVR